MIARLDWHGEKLEIDFAAGQSIAIPLDPHGPQPAFFTDFRASARPLSVGDYIGDIAQGGSCQAEVIEFAPHCHGTHTECLSHVSGDRTPVQQAIHGEPALARLVSIEAEMTADGPSITLAALQVAAGDLQSPLVEALIIRTLPNDPQRMARDYSRAPSYAVLSNEAMAWLSALPLKHLLLDTPSLDKADDGGKLANHKRWWGLQGRAPDCGVEPGRRSVTEMIFVPDEIDDGFYWLHLELSPIAGDATPSRPVLYPVRTGP